jgi:hypothetical protein
MPRYHFHAHVPAQQQRPCGSTGGLAASSSYIGRLANRLNAAEKIRRSDRRKAAELDANMIMQDEQNVGVQQDRATAVAPLLSNQAVW